MPDTLDDVRTALDELLREAPERPSELPDLLTDEPTDIDEEE